MIVAPLFGSGPVWPIAVTDVAHNCERFWWENTLFVNNLLGYHKVSDQSPLRNSCSIVSPVTGPVPGPHVVPVVDCAISRSRILFTVLILSIAENCCLELCNINCDLHGDHLLLRVLTRHACHLSRNARRADLHGVSSASPYASSYVHYFLVLIE